MKATSAARAYEYESVVEQQAQVRVIKQNEVEKENRRFVARLTTMLVLLVVLMVGTVYSRLVLTETKASINSYNSKLTELESQNAYLSYKLDSMVSLENAEQYATSELGLVKLDTTMIEYVSLQKENVIESDTDGATMGEMLSEFVSGIVDFLAR